MALMAESAQTLPRCPPEWRGEPHAQEWDRPVACHRLNWSVMGPEPRAAVASGGGGGAPCSRTAAHPGDGFGAGVPHRVPVPASVGHCLGEAGIGELVSRRRAARGAGRLSPGFRGPAGGGVPGRAHRRRGHRSAAGLSEPRAHGCRHLMDGARAVDDKLAAAALAPRGPTRDRAGAPGAAWCGEEDDVAVMATALHWPSDTVRSDRSTAIPKLGGPSEKRRAVRGLAARPTEMCGPRQELCHGLEKSCGHRR